MEEQDKAASWELQSIKPCTIYKHEIVFTTEKEPATVGKNPIIQPDSSRKANLAIPECPSPNGVGNSETEEERREDEEEKKQRVAYWSERAPQYWHDTSRVRVRVTTVVVAAVSVTSVKAAE